MVVYVSGIKYGICEVFEDKVILVGCEVIGVFDVIKVVNGGDKKVVEKVCIVLWIDGVFVDIDGDYIEILVFIEFNKDGVGVFGLVFYENNIDKL